MIPLITPVSKAWTLALGLAMVTLTAAAELQPSTLELGMQSSSRVFDLNGEWRFRFDPDGRGEDEGWRKGGGEAWQNIEVPGSFNVLFPDKLWYQGKAWYERTFELPADADPADRIIVRFLGAAIRKKVWLNGRLIGEHLYPYNGFQFDLTPLVNRSGENRLTVLVDNSILERAIPDHKWDGWWCYGGLTREVLIELRPPVAATNLWMDTVKADKGWEFTITGAIRNTTGETRQTRARFWIETLDGRPVFDQTLEITLKPGKNRVMANDRLNNIQTWTPGRAKLYRVGLQVDEPRGHGVTIRSGFRRLEVRGTKLYLNGRRFLLRGISNHEDLPGHGSTLPAERRRRDIEDIKELGCNFLRMSHYPMHPQTFDLCDELGLLTWVELPAWKTSSDSLTDPQVYKTYAEDQLAEMITQHRHHPSVAIWSVGNEFKSHRTDVAEYVRSATRFVRSLDPSRLVTFASDRRLKDKSFPHVDLISINEYYGWYYGTIHDIGGVLDQLHAKHPKKPILVSEFGAATPLGAKTSRPFRTSGMDYSEEYQVKLLQAHLEQIFEPQRRDWVAGGVIWLYNDFADPHRDAEYHPQDWKYVNLKGLVTQDRRRKPSFDLVKRFYRHVREQLASGRKKD